MKKHTPFSFSKQTMIVAVTITSIVVSGSILLAGSRAASSFAAAEPEVGTITAPAASIADTTASGAKAIEFNAPATSSPSGQAMPTTAPAGWTRTFSEDFTTDAPLGQFPGSAAYTGKWSAYDGFKDTSKNGTYSSSKVLSVSGGMLDMFIHTENGVHYVATPAVNKYKGQLYGRYTARFKSDPVAGYKTAWLLWPDSNVWNEGEIDLPEGGLNGTIGGFSHCANIGNPSSNCLAVSTKETYTSWHTSTIEWTPGKVVFYLDGVQIGSTTKNVPNTSMHWMLQTETNLSSTPPPDTSAGHVSVDWVTVDKMN